MTNNGCITQKHAQVTLQVILHKENAAYFKSVKSFVVVVVIPSIIIWFVTLQLFTISWQLINSSLKKIKCVVSI